MYITAGARRENFIMCDSKGVIYRGRDDKMDATKARFAVDTDARTLADAMRGADIFLGVSAGNVVSKEMVESMAPGAIIFAMANPTPEIYPADAIAAGAAVVGTGRTDFPNQVNNVLGFPGIFRGALDVRAADINEDMKLAAAKALAEIATEPVPAEIAEFLTEAYPEDGASGMFSAAEPLNYNYVIPKPFDSRVVPRVARYVAEAAVASGVAGIVITDFDAYEEEVAARIRRAV
jgi:malate dehydrogenase (oxaloacetate-decarboxylating)(NADP+)